MMFKSYKQEDTVQNKKKNETRLSASTEWESFTMVALSFMQIHSVKMA